MAHGSLFVAPVPGTPPVGMSATDGRLALGGIFGTTPQLVSGGGVAQSGSNMGFTVAASTWQIADVTNAASTFFAATDSTVVTSAAGPGTGSRKDLICVRAHNYENGDADSVAAVVLVPGTAGTPGGDPTVPAGYYKYAEITIPTAAATAAACSVIVYGNSTFAPPDIQAPTFALLNTMTGQPGQQASVTADGSNNGLYQWTTVWSRINAGLNLIKPTSVSGTGISLGANGAMTLTAVPGTVLVNGIFSGTFDNYRVDLDLPDSATSVTILLQLAASGTADTTSNYDTVALQGVGTTAASTQALAATSWGIVAGAGATNRTVDTSMEFKRPFLLKPTQVIATGAANATAQTTASAIGTKLLSHRVSASYDGLAITFSAGAPTGTMRVYGWYNG